MARGDNSTSVDSASIEVSKRRSAGGLASKELEYPPEDVRRAAEELRGATDEPDLEPPHRQAEDRKVPDLKAEDASDTSQGAAFLSKLETDYRNQADLPAAFELIAEACAAVKIAEDRVLSAEEALEDATSYYAGQIEALTEQLNDADLRAEAAERHAARAEERLRIFCQTILTTMHKI